MVKAYKYIKHSIPYPTIGEIINKKDHDYVSYRLWCGGEYGEYGIFAGCFSVKNGEIISLDGDIIYNKNEKVIASEEWTNEEEGVQSGLTVIVK